MRPSFAIDYFFSSLMHGVVIALFLFFTYEAQHRVREVPKVFEMVAGEGDNLGATEAPALGVANGVKLSVPNPPAPAPTPEPTPQPAAATPPPPQESPLQPAPVPPTPKAAPAPKPPNFVKDVKRIAAKREANIEKKFHDEQAKQAKADALKAKQMTKEQFDKDNKGKTQPSTSANAPKVARIDAEGIAKGVTGGSTANKVGGAGGKAMSREEGDLMDVYFSMLKERLKGAFEQPPGLSDALVARVELTVAADGSLSRARIARSSGSAEFDRAVLEAVSHIHMPERPDHKTDSIGFAFSMKEKDEG